MRKSKIEWCDSTWNPVTGCLHGCEYCYARRIANRFSYTKDWKAFPSNLELDEPIIDAVTGRATAYPHGFAPTLHRYRLDEPQKWNTPKTIFVCSMADLFGEWVPDEWIEEVFAVCDAAPQHRYLFLTKNPRRYLTLAEADKLRKGENFWYGSTITNPDAPFFFSGNHNTFLSIEPLLKPFPNAIGEPNLESMPKLMIIGAETGNRKDKVIPQKEWVDSICEAADIAYSAVFMKDSLIPIVGSENMRREFPWSAEETDDETNII